MVATILSTLKLQLIVIQQNFANTNGIKKVKSTNFKHVGDTFHTFSMLTYKKLIATEQVRRNNAKTSKV